MDRFFLVLNTTAKVVEGLPVPVRSHEKANEILSRVPAAQVFELVPVSTQDERVTTIKKVIP